MNDDGYYKLASAIVERALLDFREALICNKETELDSLRKFLISDWFIFLSNMDGEIIMAYIERMVRE